MKIKLLSMMLLAGSIFAQTRFSIGNGVGGHGTGYYQPDPPSYRANASPRPGPDYTWVNGYWSQNGGRDMQVAGSWNRQQPYQGSYQVAPPYNSRYNNAYAEKGFTRSLDQDRERDWDRDRDWDRRTDRDGDRDDDHGRRSNGFSNEFRGR